MENPYETLLEAIEDLDEAACTICPNCKISIVRALKAVNQIITKEIVVYMILDKVRKPMAKPTKIIKSKKQKRLEKIRRKEENERS